MFVLSFPKDPKNERERLLQALGGADDTVPALLSHPILAARCVYIPQQAAHLNWAPFAQLI